MDFKKILNLDSYEWWKNHRKLIGYGGIAILLSLYISPLIQDAKNKNRCVILAKKEIKTLARSKVLTPEEESFVAAYQICNHRS